VVKKKHVQIALTVLKQKFLRALHVLHVQHNQHALYQSVLNQIYQHALLLSALNLIFLLALLLSALNLIFLLALHAHHHQHVQQLLILD
jgi:hypothetical protein